MEKEQNEIFIAYSFFGKNKGGNRIAAAVYYATCVWDAVHFLTLTANQMP